MNSLKLRLILIIIISFLIGYYFGVTKIAIDFKNYNPKVVVASKEPPPSISNLDFSLFWTVLDKLETDYYDKSVLDPQKILNGAISGMVASLNDPYTIYLPAQQNQDFKQALAGQFGGIGAELGLKDGKIVIIAPLDGSPAQKAGIKAGDAILKVNGKLIDGMTLNQVVDEIRGPKGTTVTLTVAHKSDNVASDVAITRDTISVKSVTSWIKPIKDIDGISTSSFSDSQKTSKVAYIRLSQFGDTTNQEWSNAINKISTMMQKDNSVKGVVLDLRNNPGGYLTDAVFIASEFLKDGVVVIQDDGRGNQVPLSVSRKGLLIDTPLVVLINKGSASASEIVSGALRDHNRAKLVGETSFGKGTIQEAQDLGQGAGLHITIAKWLTPDGTWVHMKGLTPDVVVGLDQKDQTHDLQLEKAIGTVLQ